MSTGWMTPGDKTVLATVVTACGVCCAAPLVSILAAIGVTSAAFAFALPALTLVTAAAGAGIWWLRRRSRAQRVSPSGTVSLPMPTLRPFRGVDHAKARVD